MILVVDQNSEEYKETGILQCEHHDVHASHLVHQFASALLQPFAFCPIPVEIMSSPRVLSVTHFSFELPSRSVLEVKIHIPIQRRPIVPLQCFESWMPARR